MRFLLIENQAEIMTLYRMSPYGIPDCVYVLMYVCLRACRRRLLKFLHKNNIKLYLASTIRRDY